MAAALLSPSKSCTKYILFGPSKLETYVDGNSELCGSVWPSHHITKPPQPHILSTICPCASPSYLVSEGISHYQQHLHLFFWRNKLGLLELLLGVSGSVFPCEADLASWLTRYQSSVYPSNLDLCFGFKFLNNKILLWHFIWPSG